MRACLRLILTLTAVVALTTACTPFGSTSSRNRLPEDSRFAEFTYKTDGEIKVQERTDSFNERMPALGATAGHVAAANFPEGRSSLPSPDHHFWVTGVATVAPESIQKLSEGATGNNTLLPGIYPGLYQYVPPGLPLRHHPRRPRKHRPPDKSERYLLGLGVVHDHQLCGLRGLQPHHRHRRGRHRLAPAHAPMLRWRYAVASRKAAPHPREPSPGLVHEPP